MIQYNTMNDIIESMRIACECGIREKAFDWKEIAIKGFKNKRRIIKLCKPYGKIKLVPQGFIIKFGQGVIMTWTIQEIESYLNELAANIDLVFDNIEA